MTRIKHENLQKALKNLGISDENIKHLENGDIEIKERNIEADSKTYVAQTFLSGDAISAMDFDDVMNNVSNISPWQPFEDCSNSWLASQMETELDALHAFSSVEFIVNTGFYHKGNLILDETKDENGNAVEPAIYYQDSYNNYMIGKYEKEYNALLAGTNVKVSIYETSEYYESEDEFDSLPMFEACLEDENDEAIDDTTTGRYCSLQSVCDELEGFVYDIRAKRETYFDDSKYTYNETILSVVFDPESQAGMLESYNEDYEQVRTIHEHTPRKVWSVIDGDDDKVHVVADFVDYEHVIYYIITNEDCKGLGETYFLGGETC